MKHAEQYLEPKVDQNIYVPSAYHVYSGADDFKGGLCTISEVLKDKNLPPDHFNYCFIKIKEGNPATSYNYKYLLEQQDELRELFCENKGHQDPDMRPEFNCSTDTDWVEIKRKR